MHSAAKAVLRSELSAVRAARAAGAVEAARRQVRAAVLARCVAAGWRCVGAYVPLRTEPGSHTLLDALTGLGIRVLVPVLLGDRDLDWAEWDAAGQRAGPPLGVTAIADADAVFVPALAVAPDGTRLGRGGGSYDRALRRVRAEVPAVALIYDGELVPALPSDAWDVPVTAVVSPSGWQQLPLS